jgi:hypothetical protein
MFTYLLPELDAAATRALEVTLPAGSWVSAAVGASHVARLEARSLIIVVSFLAIVVVTGCRGKRFEGA